MARDWHTYNKALVKRGEILLDLSLLQSWGEELQEMNRGREGGRYRYPDTLITLQAHIKAAFRLPYRQLEGLTRALAEWEPRLTAPDYSTSARARCDEFFRTPVAGSILFSSRKAKFSLES